MKILYFIPLLFISTITLAQECKTIDLSEEGGVLHPLRATNQNGLGICHIEQLQRQLKAKLENSPDLARISMAILEKAERDKNLSYKPAVRWKKLDGTPGGVFIDAGNECEAFNRLKGKDLCESKDDLFENFTKSNAFDQQKIIGALALYFDGTSAAINSPLVASTIMEAIEADYLNATMLCPLEKKTVDFFIEQYKDAGGIGNPEHLRELQVKTYMQSRNMQDYIQEILPDIEDILLKNANVKMIHNALVLSLQNQEKCATSKINMKSENICKIDKNENLAKILDLSVIGFTGKDLYRFASYTQDRDEYFKNALYCSGKKIQIPSTLSCSIIDLKEMSKEENYIQSFSEIVEKNLETKTPLGISICTRFFKDPRVSTLKDGVFNCGDQTALDYRDGEGSHAVTIIGQRCEKGKKEFLVHNSWGAGCGYYHDSYECNRKGGVWITEKVLAKNSRSLNVIK